MNAFSNNCGHLKVPQNEGVREFFRDKLTLISLMKDIFAGMRNQDFLIFRAIKMS